jgi:hypothetical protein
MNALNALIGQLDVKAIAFRGHPMLERVALSSEFYGQKYAVPVGTRLPPRMGEGYTLREPETRWLITRSLARAAKECE